MLSSMAPPLFWLLVAVALRLLAGYLFQPSFAVHKSGCVVITGASSGIGEHAAIALAGEGYTVFAGVRKQADADRLAAAHEGIRPLFLEVTSDSSIRSAVEIVGEACDFELVALVNNAGVQRDLPVELQDPAADRFTFEVNVYGLLDTSRAFISLLRATGGGARIVNIGSLAGVVAAPGSATYSASKFAVEGISDALRLELKPFGISVSLLQPGYVRSKMGVKAHVSSARSYGVAQANYELYRPVFEGFFAEDQRLSSDENAEFPDTTTTPAILDAIQSPMPKTRYPVASVDGLPTWLIATLKSILPDRVMDTLV